MAKRIKLYNPSKPQRAASNIFYKDKPFITLLKYGRQTGKSYWGLMTMLESALNTPNQKIRYVVPSYSLAVRHMQTIDMLFSDNEDVKSLIFKKIKYKEQEYHFHNGTIASFLSAEAEDNLRGDTCHLMFIDEAAFIKEKTFTEILLPMLTRTKGRLAMFSTPNGKNWFFDFYLKGKNPKHSKLVKSLDATYMDLEEEDDFEDIKMVITALKASMTKDSFKREVLAEFVSDESLFANIKECIRSDEWFEDYEKEVTSTEHGVPVYERKLYIGVDIGVLSDYTVITVIDQNNVVVGIDRFNMKEEDYTATQFKQRIYNFIARWRPNITAGYIEANNKAVLVDELIYEMGLVEMFEITTSATNKPLMVNSLAKLFDEEAIIIPKHHELEKELYAFRAMQNKITGKWQYKGSDGIHDDMVMSMCLAAYCKQEEETGGVTEVY